MYFALFIAYTVKHEKQMYHIFTVCALAYALYTLYYVLTMTDTKMLQAIANSIALIRKEMKDGFKEMNEKMNKGFKSVNERLDMQGKSLAYLEDDAPTIKSHNNLKKRVKRLEDKVFGVV